MYIYIYYVFKNSFFVNYWLVSSVRNKYFVIFYFVKKVNVLLCSYAICLLKEGFSSYTYDYLRQKLKYSLFHKTDKNIVNQDDSA